MLKGKKIRKIVLYVIAGLLLLLLIGIVYFRSLVILDPPKPENTSSQQLQRTIVSNNFYTLGNNWFRKSKSGLYELYVEGDPFERGVIGGKLTKELVVRQEDHFNEQINKMIPSKGYLNFLKYFIAWFNRDLDENISDEYKEEIYGISLSAAPKYTYIGSNYQRILNYHAAHDIGHALQSMALVGCTSFGTWNARSEDSTMIIGRNFDFYVGDKFAEDKIVAFFRPSQGYKFMSVTWGGFVGAVSGMNEKGLTVTINAAKTNMPSGSATPVSLVAREMLQYAKNINEALSIAKKRKMFVSESFLVASAEDNKAVVIEKTPEDMDVYDPKQDYILCANHFQGERLKMSNENKQQVSESASSYRYQRLSELMKNNVQNSVTKTISILRDRKGLHDAEIGLGNEKAVNQLIAHHSIVFQPGKLRVWISTAPWQLGAYVAYDLKKVFDLRGMKQDLEIQEVDLMVPADSFLMTEEFKKFEVFRKMKQRITNGEQVSVDSLIESNPQFYHTYVLAGDYEWKLKQYPKALLFYQKALTKEIATKNEEKYIREQIEKCNNKLGH